MRFDLFAITSARNNPVTPMPLTAFDHVNIRTARLGIMIDWYGDILGLTPCGPPWGRGAAGGAASPRAG